MLDQLGRPKGTWSSDHGVWISLHFAAAGEWLVAGPLSWGPGGVDRRRDRSGGPGQCPRLRHHGPRRIHEGREAAAERRRGTFRTRQGGAAVTRDRKAGRL